MKGIVQESTAGIKRQPLSQNLPPQYYICQKFMYHGIFAKAEHFCSLSQVGFPLRLDTYVFNRLR